MELDEVMRTTFAAREFTDDPVSDEVLWQIFDLARFAPSGGNRQGGHVVVIRDPDTRARVAELSKTAARRYLAQRGAGESPWNPVHPPGITQQEIAEVPGVDDFVAPVGKAPVLLVFSVDLAVVAAVDQNLDRIGVVSGASVYPLIWNTLLAARSLGYGGTFTTMAVAEEPAMRELLGLPDTHAIAAVVPLGKPVKQLTKLRRRPVEEFVTWERFDGAPLDA
ncbi:nitroreductase family protein [Gordonia sp. ABSL49_1]|uniref:nitroreductase family protein n=1 Tax=Gordonia sp. ABSL49_1 TaxID=2920941 RepID=UPI001F1148D3|nr:nitroreductase family protein [Gordonia sp. ABSL49_1]MCH5643333.1 nitroreductase family protein [Gordonia sp. ABSL49_1]